MELDIYLPSLSIAFEYQGHYHYHNNVIIGATDSIQKRDQMKQTESKRLGITLIPVPYTWRHDKETIIKLVNHHRPDLVPVPPFNSTGKNKPNPL
jgi:hypothetical protein